MLQGTLRRQRGTVGDEGRRRRRRLSRLTAGRVRAVVRPGGRVAASFVMGTWGLLAAGALAGVARYGSNVPSWDDWDMVPAYTGAQPVTPAWLWSQHNEHRVPLPRLALLGLARLAGTDFRAAMIADVVALAALCAALLAALQARMGGLRATDAFLPLVMLHWGQAPNFLWSWQLQFFASAVLAGCALLAITAWGKLHPVRAAGAVGLFACLLPLCGANGVALVPGLAAWVGYVGMRRWRSGKPHTRRGGAALLALAAAGLGLAALYFIGWERVPYHPSTHQPRTVLSTSLRFLAIGLGPGIRGAWPWVGLGVLGLGGATAVLMLRVARDRPAERVRSAGLLLFLGAMASLALGLGAGRDGFEPRYVTLALPAWCGVYLAWRLYGESAPARAVRGSLLAAALIVLAPNVAFGVRYGADLRGGLASFERELASGAPPYRLIGEYAPVLHPHHDVLTDYLPLLRRARVGAFRKLAEDPPLREVRLPLRPLYVSGAVWRPPTVFGTSNEPFLVFALPRDTCVAGVRVHYSYGNPQGTAPYVTLYWKDSRRRDFSNRGFWKYSPTGDRANWERATYLRAPGGGTRLTFWISERIDGLRLHPDYKPGVFTIRDMVLLLPPDGATSAPADSGAALSICGPAPLRTGARAAPTSRAAGGPGRAASSRRT